MAVFHIDNIDIRCYNKNIIIDIRYQEVKRIAQSKISDPYRADVLYLTVPQKRMLRYGYNGKIKSITEGRIILGPGTLYNLLEQFVAEKIIVETKIEGRRRSYILTDKGKQILESEYNRIRKQADDYINLFGEEKQ